MRGKLFYSATFDTRSYPFLKELHSLFYKDGVKVLPGPAILFDLLTPIALQNMIMCDGAIRNESVLICTDCFKLKEIILIMNI